MCIRDRITADLEAMHRVGLGGAYLMPIKGVEQGPQYEGKAQQPVSYTHLLMLIRI